MKKVGLVGIGDMGIGMAKNILKNGFELTGYDLREERMDSGSVCLHSGHCLGISA